jgi:hypothetical protein
LTETTAKDGKPTDSAILMTNGSVHMFGTTNSFDSIDCLIKGADYEAALVAANPTTLKPGDQLTEDDKNNGFVSADGAHYVVVYIKNEAGL